MFVFDVLEHKIGVFEKLLADFAAVRLASLHGDFPCLYPAVVILLLDKHVIFSGVLELTGPLLNYLGSLPCNILTELPGLICNLVFGESLGTSQVVRGALGGQWAFIFCQNPTVEAVAMHTTQIQQQEVKSLFVCLVDRVQLFELEIDQLFNTEDFVDQTLAKS
jgi:hypothetical protein